MEPIFLIVVAVVLVVSVKSDMNGKELTLEKKRKPSYTVEDKRKVFKDFKLNLKKVNK